MSRITLALCLLLLIHDFARAEVPAIQSAAATQPAAVWIRLFTDEAWYKDHPPAEQVFTGVLQRLPEQTNPTTLMRPRRYQLGDRFLYPADKNPDLEKLVGQKVEVRGKPYDIELEGQAVSEIWPAAVRPVAAPATQPADMGASIKGFASSSEAVLWMLDRKTRDQIDPVEEARIKKALGDLLQQQIPTAATQPAVPTAEEWQQLLDFQQMLRAEQPPTTQPDAKPPVVTGTLGKPENTAKIAAVVGRNGVLFIRSEARWDQLKKLVPDLTADTPLPKFDFAKQDVVLIYDTRCRSTDTFKWVQPDPPTGELQLQTVQIDFVLRWDNGPVEHAETASAKFILVVIPATPSVKVTLDSMPLMVLQPPMPVTEFSAILGGKDGGDIADGLQASITPKAATIKPGEDILIDFALQLAKMPDAHPAQFGTAVDVVYVWDDKYSNGYRNHGFFVTTPDGKTILLRPKVISDWDKNAPHPVTIVPEELYHLPNGADNLKSLKDLGLDTAAPGTYVINGLYEEVADTNTTPDGKKIPLWGGSIVSNTVTVEVKK